jgi:uncharacterized repeat protein (TIGR02543 family)
VEKSPDQSDYALGTLVELTVTPAVGWAFTGWSGHLTGTENPHNILMDGNKAVTASFEVTYDSLRDLVSQCVTKPGIVKSLLAKLDAAKAADGRGNDKAKAGMIGAFINEVEAQSGKAISSEHASLLIALAKAL